MALLFPVALSQGFLKQIPQSFKTSKLKNMFTKIFDSFVAALTAPVYLIFLQGVSVNDP
jgi:hypothetical protein